MSFGKTLRLEFFYLHSTFLHSLSYAMTGAELICNAIVGQNLDTKQKAPSANSVPRYDYRRVRNANLCYLFGPAHIYIVILVIWVSSPEIKDTRKVYRLFYYLKR